MAEKRVLLVENGKSTLQALGESLAKAKVEIVSCAGGLEALSQLGDKRVNAVVAAADLADISGYQLCCLIKSTDETKDLPVVLVQADAAGADEFWAKACLADSVVSAKDLKGKGDRVVKTISELLENADRAEVKPATFLAGKAAGASEEGRCKALLDRLMLDRLAERVARSSMSVIEPRKKFVDHFFSLVSSLVDTPVIGIAVAGTGNPWLALKLDEPIKGKSLSDMVARLSKQIDVHKEFALDLRGSTDDDDGKDISMFEVFPVKSDRTTLGGLIFGETGGGKFTEQARAAMSLLKGHMEPVIRLLLANQEIEQLYQREQYRASTDPLTGLYNLEFLVGFLQQQLLFSYRQRSPVGLIIVDIDHLKDVNDEFGYELGDLVLSTIGNRLLNQTRSSDLLARYGGDEFAIVLPNTDLNGAKVLAEKIRLEIEQMTFVKGPGRKGPHVTASIGCAGFNMEDLNPETILRDAKAALQRAKEGGRNRVSS